MQMLFGASDELMLLTGAHRKLNLLKLVVTGDGRVGKTSLLRCLRGDPFREDEKSTRGVELCTVEVGAEKWAITDLAAVGDFAGLLADRFRALPQHVPTAAPVAAEPSSDNAGSASSPAPHASEASAPADSPVRDGPIVITTDLPPLLCVAEGSELSLTVLVSGGTPNEPLQYRWSRNGAVLDGRVSNTLRIARAGRSAAGEYSVEVSCQSQPTPVKSIAAQVRVVSSVMDKVNKILLEHGESLSDDKPKAVVFDYGGQRIYCAVQRLLVTEPLTVYIIVVSLADDLDDQLRCPEDLRYNMTHRQNLVFWLDTIYCHAKKAKIIVVGSKVDGLSEETRKERMAKVAQCVESTLSCAKDMIAGLTYVSNKTGEGINELRTQIELLRRQLDGYGREVPFGWFKFFSITQELVNQDQRRISFEEARAIARQCGIVMDDDLRRMLQLFNDAGLLLWRSKEAIARELVVLSVDWIVKLMTSASCPRYIEEVLGRSKFVLRPHLRELKEKGILRASVLEPLWPELTESERSSVLQYMVSFGVCCQLRKPHANSTADSYLLPTLFPTVPDGSTVWDVDDERSADLRIRFVPVEYAAEIRGQLQLPEHIKDFLPDTLFFHVVARLLQSLHEFDSQNVESCHADRVILRNLAARYMLQHFPNEKMLVLRVYRDGESPRLALEQVSAILDSVGCEFGVEYFPEALLSYQGKAGYYKIHSLPGHEVSQLWLGEQRAQLEASRTAPSLGPVVVGARKLLPEGKRFHFFLSHKQQGADGYAALVREKLKALGYTCWIDTEQPADREGMEAGVKGSVCVLLFLFKGTLHRPYCQFELRLARAYGVPVIVLLEGDHYRETYISVLDLQSAFDQGELPADLKPVVDKADFNFFYRRQNHEQAAMISKLCEKLEAATATGPWPAFTQVADASGEAVGSAYRLLDEEVRAGAARPTVAPSAQQAAPPKVNACLGAEEDSVPEGDCQWACFISHHQAAATLVRWLGSEIERRLEAEGKLLTRVCIDKQQTATDEGMYDGVRRSQHFILYMTKEALLSKYCLQEIEWALKHRKNIILVCQQDEHHGGVPGSFFNGHYEDALRQAFPNEVDVKWLLQRSPVYVHDRGQHADVMFHDAKAKAGILDQMPLSSIRPVSAPADPLQSGLPTSARPRHVSSSKSVDLAFTQAAPSNQNAEASNALAAKEILPTLHDLLQEADLSQWYEAITAQGYSCALDLAEASPEELAQLVLHLQLRPPEGRRLQRSVQRLGRPQQ
jgi:hypothetical protein